LRTEFSTDPTNGTDPRAVAEILNHPYIHPCVSDGGAHVRYLTLGTWSVNLLATWTRDRQVMSLEKAHYKISGLPAWIAGFTDRGILRDGFAADLIVYAQEKLGSLYGRPVDAAEGARMSDVVGLEQGSQSLPIEAPCVAPTARIPRRINRRTEVAIIVQEGKLDAIIGRERVLIGPGDTVLAPAGSAHGFL